MKPKCIVCGTPMTLDDKDRDEMKNIISSFWICDKCHFYLHIDFYVDDDYREISGEIESVKE